MTRFSTIGSTAHRGWLIWRRILDALKHIGMLQIVDANIVKLPAPAQAAIVREMVEALEKVGSRLRHRLISRRALGLRVLDGRHGQTGDVEALLPWLEWAFLKAIGHRSVNEPWASHQMPGNFR